MTEEKEITCIVCPIGCKILVKVDGDQIRNIDRNKCKRGIDYVQNEALNPRRMLTTSVLVNGGKWPLVSVKSSQPIPKEKVFRVLEEMKKTKIKAPIKSGQKILKNVANTGIDLLATKTVKKL